MRRNLAAVHMKVYIQSGDLSVAIQTLTTDTTNVRTVIADSKVKKKRKVANG